MAPTTTANHDPGLSQQPQGTGAPGIDISNINLNQLSGLDRSQILTLLSHIPGIFNKGVGGADKEDAAQTLQALSAAQGAAQGGQVPNFGQAGTQHQLPAGFPGISDPGPSSHPRGPPNLGQLSAAAMQVAPAPPGVGGVQGVMHMQQAPRQDDDGGSDDDKQDSPAPGGTTSVIGGRGRGRGGAAMGSDEWTRQRKDNHKEVERRRRGNINEGINELGRIVPNGSGEKAKGAILSRAVQYIHHLKENEARNIEKWTLEKLLMDQAMGDLQAQLEEVRRMWEEERSARARAEKELEMLRGGKVNGAGTPSGGAGSGKRGLEDGQEDADGKRQRTE